MMGVFTDILETISIAVSGFMIRKYVFLEPAFGIPYDDSHSGYH